MAKSTNGKRRSTVRPAAGRPAVRPVKVAQPPTVTGHDIARRAYELYLARDCEHGHDLDDWFQAERELQK